MSQNKSETEQINLRENGKVWESGRKQNEQNEEIGKESERGRKRVKYDDENGKEWEKQLENETKWTQSKTWRVCLRVLAVKL